MKQVKLQLTGMQTLADGRTVFTVKPNSDYKNAAVVANPGQVERLARRALGFGGVMAAIALKQAIAVSNGAATIAFQQDECKAGEAWENPVTREKGIYGANNGNKDWTRSSNHEIELGLGASLKLLEMSAGAAIAQIPVVVPVAVPSGGGTKTPIGIKPEDENNEPQP